MRDLRHGKLAGRAGAPAQGVGPRRAEVVTGRVLRAAGWGWQRGEAGLATSGGRAGHGAEATGR